jgi:hypothetical protein
MRLLSFARIHVFSLMLLLVVLYPIYTSPIVGDDLINPFVLLNDSSFQLSKALSMGFSAGNQFHTNFIGQSLGHFIYFFWPYFDIATNFPHIVFYAILRLLVLTVCWYSIYLICSLYTHRVGKSSTVRQISINSSLIFSGTLQLHQIWSNDPVGNYPLTGYMSVALSMFTLYYIFLNKSQRSVKVIAFGALMVLICLYYYEMNVSLLPAIFIFLILDCKLKVRDLDKIKLFFWVLFPALLWTSSYLKSLEYASLYGGTTRGSFTEIPGNFLISVFSGFPMGGWLLSVQYLPNASSSALISTICFAGFLFIVLSRVNFFQRVNAQSVNKSSKNRSNDNSFAIFGALFSYMFFCVLIISSTQKYQQEITLVGHVYSSYSAVSVFFAIFCTIKALEIQVSASLKRLNFIRSLLILFVVMQFGINQGLSEVASNMTNPSQTLVNSFSNRSTDFERCQAWQTWAAGQWPDYYESSMGIALGNTFKELTGAPFCTSGTNPIK